VRLQPLGHLSGDIGWDTNTKTAKSSRAALQIRLLLDFMGEVAEPQLDRCPGYCVLVDVSDAGFGATALAELPAVEAPAAAALAAAPTEVGSGGTFVLSTIW
jgi:hypothetical protein